MFVAAWAASAPLGAQTRGGSLSVATADGWLPWEESRDGPVRWPAADPRIEGAVSWTVAAPGVERGVLRLRGPGGWSVSVILVRLDPAVVVFDVVVPPRSDDGFAGRWRIDDAPDDALVAVNAGQFTSGPWGWLVQGGRLRQPPGSGSQAPGVAFLTDGRVGLLPPDSLPLAEGVGAGFQSYPALLVADGEVPGALRSPGGGVDRTHRDGRLALGLLRDGRVLLALTRLEGLGGLLEVVPFGPTTPEMAAVMGALGCARAVLLDGGISGQMMLREQGVRRVWPGLRPVAAGLVVRRAPKPGS